jgi:hypothetical protein
MKPKARYGLLVPPPDPKTFSIRFEGAAISIIQRGSGLSGGLPPIIPGLPIPMEWIERLDRVAEREMEALRSGELEGGQHRFADMDGDYSYTGARLKEIECVSESSLSEMPITAALKYRCMGNIVKAITLEWSAGPPLSIQEKFDAVQRARAASEEGGN